jgi:hypothetical protein
MKRPILLIETRLAVSQLVSNHLNANGYACTHILGSAEPQRVFDHFTALDTNGQRVEIELRKFPVAIFDKNFAESAPGVEMIWALQASRVNCICFDFSAKVDILAFDKFLQDDILSHYSRGRLQGTFLGRIMRRIVRFIWRCFEWLIK